MSPGEPPVVCANCGLPREKVDSAGWCAECRAEVVGRAGAWAWGAAALIAVPVAVLLAWSGALAHRFVMFWIALAAALLFVVFKVARRVAFEMIRARGVPRPEE